MLSPSFKEKIIAADNEAITIAQNVLTHLRYIIDRNTVSAPQIKNHKLSVWLKFDLRVIARDAFIFDDNIIAQLPTDIDDRFFNAIDLLTSLGQGMVNHAWGRGGIFCMLCQVGLLGSLTWEGMAGCPTLLGMPGNCCPGGSCARRAASCSALSAWVAIAPSPAAWRSASSVSMRTSPVRKELSACRRITGIVLRV